MIPADDRGFTLGDGVFETVLAVAGRLVAVDEHIGRLSLGAAALGLPAPDAADVERRMRAALADAGLLGARAAVRVSWSAGSGGRGLDRPDSLTPRLVVTASPAALPLGPARLALASTRRNEGSVASRHKTLAYLDNVLARREARDAGADEAVMLNGRGEIACAAAANLFWIKEQRLFTPRLDCGVLAGIVRGQVLAAAARLRVGVQEVACSEPDVRGADAIFLTNSLIGVRPALYGAVAAGHPLTTAIATAVADAQLM